MSQVVNWSGGDAGSIDDGQWSQRRSPALADHVAAAGVRLRPDDGHLSLMITAYGEILDALLGR